MSRPAALAIVIGALVLAAGGLLLHDRVTAVDSWGHTSLRLTSVAAADVAAAVSDGLRLVCAATALAAISWLLWRRRLSAVRPALVYSALLLAVPASSQVLKGLFERPHPTEAGEWSYPSTHIAIVMVGAVVTAAVASQFRPRWRPGLIAVAVAAITVTAATRVLLGEHHLTDVLLGGLGYAGLCLGGVMLARDLGPSPSLGRPARCSAP